jgi:ketosteroid isomerase-like protein
MRHYRWLPSLIAVVLIAGCTRTVDVRQERNLLMQRDQEWSGTITDAGRFVSFLAADASIYPAGMPIATGEQAIREMHKAMTSSPGFSLRWTPAKAEVSAAGDIGYTTGTYEATMANGTEKGKYVTLWRKQADGNWKVAEDIFNADSVPQAPPSPHVAAVPSALKWGDPPPGLPVNAQIAVLAGDPSKAEPYAVRLKVPAGYKVPPHWHPTDENVTIVSGTLALGMGEKFDPASMQDFPAGGYSVLPAKMNHYAMAKTAAVIQIHGVGPFAITYVNPADDPRQQAN